jgi:hypothetical protein
LPDKQDRKFFLMYTCTVSVHGSGFVSQYLLWLNIFCVDVYGECTQFGFCVKTFDTVDYFVCTARRAHVHILRLNKKTIFFSKKVCLFSCLKLKVRYALFL